MQAISKIIYVNIFVWLLEPAYLERSDFYMQSTSQTLKVISDLPSLSDLQTYMEALKLHMNFLAVNTKCVDFSMKFGLFLLNVNLKPLKQEESLPVSIRHDLNLLTTESDKLQRKFEYQLERTKINRSIYYEVTKMYTSMLTNDTAWSMQILKLDLDLLKEIYSYSHPYPEWDRYLVELDDIIKWMPNPDRSNQCLKSLALNEIKNDEYPHCDMERDCLEMLDFGTNFGYALTLKLLFLFLARLSRGCSMFSILQDERIRHHLCKSAYTESEYIADNNFRKIDLMVEHISLCTLDGHAQFLRRSWINAFLKFQTSWGYYSETFVNSEDIQTIQQKLERSHDGDNVDINDICFEHLNAVSMGALSAAIRFILENYH